MKPYALYIASAFLFTTISGCAEGVDNPSLPNDQNQNQGNQGNQNQGNQGNQNQGNQGNQNQGNQGNQNQGNQNASDESIARARIAQTVSTEKAFNDIAYSNGFPVITSENSVIFMHWHDGGSWAVAGGLNNWTPQPMTQQGDIWYAELPIPDGLTDLGYKFVNTANDQQTYVADPWALRYTHDEYGEISYISAPPTPHLMRWNNFNSPQKLATRAIRAYVPNTPPPYDVIYAHDGQNLFGDSTVTWDLPTALASISANILVVGIDNSTDRFAEYTHVDDTIEFAGQTLHVTANGDNYAAFVETTVRPFIESKFQTTAKAGLMGSSLGGLISLYIAHLYPNRYKAVLALSPTTAWGDFSAHNPTIASLYQAAGHRSTTIYVDSGGSAGSGCKNSPADAIEDENSRDNYCYTKAFADALHTIGYEYDKDLFHWHEPGAQHDEAAWAARVSRPLKIFSEIK